MDTERTATFDEMAVLAEDGVEVFVLGLSEAADPPPYYIDVAGRRFSYASTTFPVKGHGALLPGYVREEESAGRLVLFAERGGRYLAYVHDPNAPEDDDEE